MKYGLKRRVEKREETLRSVLIEKNVVQKEKWVFPKSIY